jgi:hypothetical protein
MGCPEATGASALGTCPRLASRSGSLRVCGSCSATKSVGGTGTGERASEAHVKRDTHNRVGEQTSAGGACPRSKREGGLCASSCSDVGLRSTALAETTLSGKACFYSLAVLKPRTVGTDSVCAPRWPHVLPTEGRVNTPGAWGGGGGRRPRRCCWRLRRAT